MPVMGPRYFGWWGWSFDIFNVHPDGGQGQARILLMAVAQKWTGYGQDASICGM
jgi:hypothetical protein